MFVYPHIDPVLVQLGPIKIHWYGTMYLLAFLTAWLLGRWRIRHYQLSWTTEQLSDLIFYAALGVIAGGRLGYMLFYQPAILFTKPWELFYIWQGGMSFHGGLIGVAISLIVFSRMVKKPVMEVLDFTSLLVPSGLAFGRIGNFINGELWGRVTDVPWAFIFPHVDGNPRHPSQLYECALEGVLLFALLWLYARKPRPNGAISALFLIGYGLARFTVEFFRQPDAFLGFVAFRWMTMGQLLSLPMIVLGAVMFCTVNYTHKARSRQCNNT